MMTNTRVLVVGTTADYIDLIARRYPGRALFLTDRQQRQAAIEPAPDARDEVLVDLARCDTTLADLRYHLRRFGLSPTGVVCYDCESMPLAACLAEHLALDYPSAGTIAQVRDKIRCKQVWREAGLPTPMAAVGRSLTEALRMLHAVRGPIVIKPLSGSGSELVFVCHDRHDCVQAITTLQLAAHQNTRMYPPELSGLFAMEEFVSGREYSADFIVEPDRLQIVRIARKHHAPGQPLGTTLTYAVPTELPGELNRARFTNQLYRAARSLGINRALCMVDFIVRRDRAMMLELTPRPGGDCLPPLIQHCCGVDMLQLALDFAERRAIDLPAPASWRTCAAVRLIASRGGRIRHLDTERIADDPRVLEVHLKRRPGHRVVLPPDDYDSRILGHVVFTPHHPSTIEREARDIAAQFTIEMEEMPWVSHQAS